MILSAGEDLGDSLRVVMLGGDKVGVDLYRRLRAAVPECRFAGLGGAALREAFAPIGAEFGMNWTLRDPKVRRKVMILASQADHCLSDLVWRWRRGECINLIPSEQPTSAYVDGLTVSEPAARYNEHSRLKALGPGAPEVRYYKGTSFIMDKEEELKAGERRPVRLAIDLGPNLYHKAVQTMIEAEAS